MNPLTTSLAEIKSFRPCTNGWIYILAHRNAIAIAAGKSEADWKEKFPLVSCLESNSISDVLWLIGKRKVEVQVAVRFARMCADSVAHLHNKYAIKAAADAADAATYAAYVADAAYATYAATYAADAAYEQEEKNKQFLVQCINEFPSIYLSPIRPAPSI
jgi:hypothetical protein